MQNNGTKIAFIIGFLLITGYYLRPTVVNWLEQNYVEDLPQAERTAYLEENAGKMQELRENSLSLGLDLQGGMHVTMEVGTPQLVRELAGEYADSTLNNVINEASQQAFEDDSDFIEVMVQKFQQRDANARLSRYYRSDADNITRRSTNAEIQEYLKKQRDSAVDRAMEIIRTRVDRYGVTEPSILKQGNNRVVVELPGVADKQRVRDLLKGTARLEFRLAANPDQLTSAKEQILQYFSQQPQAGSGSASDASTASEANNASNTDADNTGTASDTENVSEADTDTNIASASDTTADSLGQQQNETQEQQQQAGNPLQQVMSTQTRSPYVFGYAAGSDTARVNELMNREAVKRMLPRNSVLMWGASPFQTTESGQELFELIGVRDQIEMTGDVIEEARVNFDPATNVPEVSMNMNSEGARQWSRITGANINKPIAIVLDGYVYSYPNVQSKISSGRSSITGLESTTEAEDLVNILLSGALPAPLDIVEERTVGATLGEESIQAGFYSTLVGLIIVALFMMIYYRAGGAIADLALVLNIIFILGILAAFKATLTLPGIAGIVLTIGMAVDANVLIFDRIREEQRMGKTLRAAIDAGYKNAMSAIVDANVTTFFVGIILYSFGVGPIKGFAVTLMAGIVSSLFSAIVITRVIVDYLTRDKTRDVSFG